MLVGYARVSTSDQDPALQLDAPEQAGCDRVYTETASGAQRDRPELRATFDYMRSGDTLVVWRIDRLARSMKQLIETVEDLEGREIRFRSLTESIDTNTSGGKLVFHIFGALAAARARGRTGGRPPVLDEKHKAAGLALLRDPSIRVKEVARRLGISVAALYHHFPGGRGAVLEYATNKA